MTGPQAARPHVYFQNLNAIRFIAAFLVIVHHVEQFRWLFHLPNHWDNRIVALFGELGVVLFFVLSGFLISYLLFKEQAVTGTIRVKDFYTRRALRIWPLYFLVVLSALFVLPFAPFFTIPGFGRDAVWSNLAYKLALFVFFLPNLVLTWLGLVPYASQAWSIGAEEQFYLVWPLLNRKAGNRWTLMLAVIGGYLSLKALWAFLPAGESLAVLRDFWATTPIDCMAIGGLFALVVHEDGSRVEALRRLVYSREVQWLALLSAIACVSVGFTPPHLRREFYSVLFGILICNFAANPRRIFSMETAWSSYLGKISYGLYMYHPLAIVLSIRLLQSLGAMSGSLLYPLACLMTVAIAALSYEAFEKRFIRKKLRFSALISGDNATQAS